MLDFAADNKHVLGGEAEDFRCNTTVRKGNENFLYFLGAGDIVQIENLHHLLGIFAALGGIIDRAKIVEESGFQNDLVTTLS